MSKQKIVLSALKQFEILSYTLFSFCFKSICTSKYILRMLSKLYHILLYPGQDQEIPTSSISSWRIPIFSSQNSHCWVLGHILDYIELINLWTCCSFVYLYFNFTHVHIWSKYCALCILLTVSRASKVRLPLTWWWPISMTKLTWWKSSQLAKVCPSLVHS